MRNVANAIKHLITNAHTHTYIYSKQATVGGVAAELGSFLSVAAVLNTIIAKVLVARRCCRKASAGHGKLCDATKMANLRMCVRVCVLQV